MDFELLDRHFLILGACIINVFLIFIWHIGYLMLNELRNEWSDDSVVIIFLGCIFIAVSAGVQSFALAYCLSAFIK
jgi:hypothetical protein